MTARAMEFTESDEHVMLRASVRQIAASFGHEYFHERAVTGGKTEELWQAVAGPGFLSVHLPEEHGGGGGGMSELVVVSEELATQGCPLLLVLVSVVGVVVSFATWGFLELIDQITKELYTHLPNALGYHHGPPVWWPLPILGIAGVIVALAITRLPGNGGHIPARGLAAGQPPTVAELPGIVLAGLVAVGFGVVLGPEAPLMALGPGLALMAIRLVRRDTPPDTLTLVAATGAFAALSFLFVSPLVAAVLVIEVTAIGGARLPLVLVPGLMASGIGSLLVSSRSEEMADASPVAQQLVYVTDRRGAREVWITSMAESWDRPLFTATVGFACHGLDRRGAGHRLLAGHRQGRGPGAVLRPEWASRARSPGRNVVAIGARITAGLQRPGLRAVAGQFPGWTHFPRDISGRRRRHHGLPPAGVRAHSSCGRGNGRRRGVGAEAAPLRRGAGHIDDDQGRHRR